MLVILENVPLGVDHRIRKQVEDLLGAGYAVSVVTQSSPANADLRGTPGLALLEYSAPPEPQGLLGYVVEYAVSLAWAALHSARTRLRSRIHVVELIQPPDVYFPLARLLKWAGARILIDQHDLMPEMLAMRQGGGTPRLAGVLRWLERRSQRIADESICTNDYQRRRLIGAGASPDRVTVVRNGPVLARVRTSEPDPSLKEGAARLCCWIGKMGRQDRLDLVLHAVRHVVRELGVTDTRFVLLGDGECLDEARGLSSELGLDPWVTFPGWVPESAVFTYLATADLGLDASLQADVSPVKIYEYMAFGLPFVSFDLPETTAIGGAAGSYVAPGDVAALARELVALLQNPDRRADMARTGRRRVEDDLAWEHQAKKYLAVVDRLSHDARRPVDRRGRSSTAAAPAPEQRSVPA